MLRRFFKMSPPLAILLALALVALVFTGCTPKSPEEQVAEARSKYKVTLNAFIPQEPEVAPVDETMGDEAMGEEGTDEDSAAEPVSDEPATDESGDEAAGDEATDAATDEEAMADTAASSERDIFFDVIVQFDGTDPLDGITVEVTHADPFEKVKGTFLQYLETGRMVKSETKQVSFTRTVSDFEDGDLFSIELRGQVPPAERAEYREFAEAGSGGE